MGVRSRALTTFVALAVTGALATACAPAQQPQTPTAAVPTAAPTPTPEPTEADPYAIPDEIDEAYVERVLEALNEGLVRATRVVAEKERVNGEAKKALGYTHLPEAQRGYVSIYREVLRGNGSVRLREDAEAVDIVSVDRIVSATDSCIFAMVTQDSSGLVQGRVEPFPVYYHLVRSTRSNDFNPTPWMVAADAEPPPNGKEFKDRCAEG